MERHKKMDMEINAFNAFSDDGLCRLRDVLEVKRRRQRIDFMSFLKRQVRFIGWKIWLGQGVLLLLLYGVFAFTTEGPLLHSVRYTAYFLCCLSMLLMLSAAPMFYRCIRYTMYEIELASRFSIVKLLFARILIIGIGDVVLLTGLLWLTAIKTQMRAESALLYILLSYLTAGAGFLYLLGHVPVKKLQMGSIGLGCALFSLFFLLKQYCPVFFVQTFSVGWVAVCLMLFLICIWQLRYLLHDSAYAQVQML